MKMRVAFFVLCLLLVIPGTSMGASKDNIFGDILKGVINEVISPNGEGSILGGAILEDSSYEGAAYDKGSGVTLRYKIFTSSLNDGKSKNPDEYDLTEVDLSERLYIEKGVAKVFFRLDVINPKGKVIRIRHIYGSLGKGKNAQPKRSQKDSIAGNMKNARFFVPIIPGNRFSYRNEIQLIVSADGFEVFRIGPFATIKR